jgi:hypothetical protein
MCGGGGGVFDDVTEARAGRKERRMRWGERDEKGFGEEEGQRIREVGR